MGDSWSGMAADFEAARAEQGASLFGVPDAGIYALCVERKGGGLGMKAYEGGQFILGFTLAQVPGEAFAPESCISDCSGPVWNAIAESSKVPDNQKFTRAWQSWQEMFEGMALLRQWSAGSVSHKAKWGSHRKP